VRQPYLSAGEWAAWATHVQPMGPTRFTWSLVRACSTGCKITVARGSAPSEAACKRAGGTAYRTILKVAVREIRGEGTPVETVTFYWSREHGDCAECALPAAFCLTDSSGIRDTDDLTGELRPESLRCAICAANNAADGEFIARIVEEV
jgi:hypothetical protein